MLVFGWQKATCDAKAPFILIFEPPHDKTNNVVVRPAKTQISLGIRPVILESSLSAWRKLGSLAIQWAHSEDSDRTGRMPRLIWVFARHTLTLLVLSRGGSFIHFFKSFTMCQIFLLSKKNTETDSFSEDRAWITTSETTHQFHVRCLLDHIL